MIIYILKKNIKNFANSAKLNFEKKKTNYDLIFQVQ